MTAPVTALLTADEIAALRAAYNESAMLAASAGALTGPYAPAGDLIHAVLAGLYDTATMPARERERCLVAVLADHARGAGTTLAVHLYWGLAVGLSPDDLARTLMLAGVYTGIPNFAFGLSVAATTFTTLKGAVAAGGDATASASVLKALRAAFEPAPATPKV